MDTTFYITGIAFWCVILVLVGYGALTLLVYVTRAVSQLLFELHCVKLRGEKPRILGVGHVILFLCKATWEMFSNGSYEIVSGRNTWDGRSWWGIWHICKKDVASQQKKA